MSKKYLLIDDEGISINDTTFYIKYYIENTDITIHRNCSDAIKALEENIFDLIILDIQLPKGDYDFGKERADLRYGLDVLEIIQIKYPGIPVLCFTIQAKETLGDVFKENIYYICKTADGAFTDLVDFVKNY